MSAAAPTVGHVIKYSYLWWNEYRRGLSEGLKERPACVVLNKTTQSGETLLYVLPITHTPPQSPEHGIEIPSATKKRLGLDDAPSWVITTELNKFTWPGYDVRRLPNGDYSYGVLPEKFIKQILAAVQENAKQTGYVVTNRDDG